jgi:hypothetical protein
MKALSIHPTFAMNIFCGLKTVECRTWKTDYRGDILICSTNKKIKGTIPGHALCVVNLKDIVPFERKHLKAACMYSNEYQDGCYAWLLDNLRFVRPVPVKGKLSLWDYDGDLEIFTEEQMNVKPENDEDFNLWEPLFV